MVDPFEMRIEFLRALRAIDEAIVRAGRPRSRCRECGGLCIVAITRASREGPAGRGGRGVRPALQSLLRPRGVPAVEPCPRRFGSSAAACTSAPWWSWRARSPARRSPRARPCEPRAYWLRTTRRWLRWWRGPFTASAPFVELSARLVPAPERRRLPLSLLDRLAGESTTPVAKLLGWLAPISHYDELPRRIAQAEGRDVAAPTDAARAEDGAARVLRSSA